MCGKSGVGVGFDFPEDFDLLGAPLAGHDEHTARFFRAVRAMANTESKRLTFERISYRPARAAAASDCSHHRFLSTRVPDRLRRPWWG